MSRDRFVIVIIFVGFKKSFRKLNVNRNIKMVLKVFVGKCVMGRDERELLGLFLYCRSFVLFYSQIHVRLLDLHYVIMLV